MPQKDVNPGAAIGLPTAQEARLETVFDFQRLFAGVVNLDGSVRPEGIKAIFERYQVDIKTFAELMGVSDSYVHAVIARRKRDRRIEDAIAARFGIEPNRMWGRSTSSAA
ncbi:hypothetical protein [Geothrix sp. PMB-07]|uniref:hypothetical protein n=1 Tax=Geothrix sp. PMB-07 TaxID=3068640 RepID=UPI0027417848|nr:hypothetical protein [Geothrix sp. PMB-07]WLT32839.1 hypothetical protein Q9293_05775 [Geothrix sp. PMB-07]